MPQVIPRKGRETLTISRSCSELSTDFHVSSEKSIISWSDFRKANFEGVIWSVIGTERTELMSLALEFSESGMKKPCSEPLTAFVR